MRERMESERKEETRTKRDRLDKRKIAVSLVPGKDDKSKRNRDDISTWKIN